MRTEQLAEQINDHLFAKEIQRINNLADILVTKNNELKQQDFHGFMLANNTFYHSRSKNLPIRNRTKTTLHIKLINESNKFQSEITQLGNEKRRIYQTIIQLLQGVENIEQLRDALPDCLHPFLFQLYPDYVTILSQPRQHPDGYLLLQNNSSDRQYRQYQKMLPIIHSYVAISML